MITINPTVVKTIVEPLCSATAGAFKPVQLWGGEHLEVDLDDELRRFVTKVVMYRPYTGVLRFDESSDQVVTIRGQEWVRENSTPPNSANHWVKQVPERTAVKGHYDKWTLAGTDFTVLIIHHAWPADRIIFKSEAAEIKYNFLLYRFCAQSRVALATANFKVHGKLPEIPRDYRPHPASPLLNYQLVPFVSFLHAEASALFMDPGTGKTAVVVNRVATEAARKVAGVTPGQPKTIFRVLVVCPNQVRSNWAHEFEKFSTTPGKVVVLRGDYDERLRRLIDGVRMEPDCAFGAAICGHDSLEPTLDAVTQVPWDLMVVDESHSIKNHRTQRWTACCHVVQQGKVRQRMILTGTPIANTLMDLWSQFEFLGEGLSGFMSFKNFSAFHGKYASFGPQGGTAVKKLIGVTNVPLLQERLSRISFAITKEEAGLELPDKVYDVIEVEMTPKQAEWYKQVSKQLALEVESLLSDETLRLSADHVLTKMLRLSQITSGFVRWDEQRDINGVVTSASRTEAIPGPNPKIDELLGLIRDDLENDPKGKKIVWACFVADIKAITQALIANGIKAVEYYGDTPDSERDAVVAAYNNDPSVKVFVANPQTAGAGLNLLGYDPERPAATNTYTDHEIFFSQGWSPVLRSQAEDRAHRKGTRANVRITDLVVPGTVDEETRARVLNKQRMALTIQDVREILNRILGLE